MAKGRAPRKKLTGQQWELAIADELQAELARRRILQKDVMAVWRVSDHSYVSRRMNGNQPMTLGEVMTLCDYLDVDAADMISRAKSNVSGPPQEMIASVA